VPTSGLQQPDRGGILQPKYKYRYRVRVLNFGPNTAVTGMDLTQQVSTVSKPKVSHEVVTVHAYNSRAYFAGKHEWGDISLTVRDDVTNAVSRMVSWQIQKQLDHFEQTGFLAASNYKFSMFEEIMDGGNDVVLESWYLEGCFLSNVEWGDMDYSSSEAQTINMTIRYDNATQIGGLMPSPVPVSVPGPMLT
jgi:hypothetical protein